MSDETEAILIWTIKKEIKFSECCRLQIFAMRKVRLSIYKFSCWRGKKERMSQINSTHSNKTFAMTKVIREDKTKSILIWTIKVMSSKHETLPKVQRHKKWRVTLYNKCNCSKRINTVHE
jgi:hypothetical protein